MLWSIKVACIIDPDCFTVYLFSHFSAALPVFYYLILFICSFIFYHLIDTCKLPRFDIAHNLKKTTYFILMLRPGQIPCNVKSLYQKGHVILEVSQKYIILIYELQQF